MNREDSFEFSFTADHSQDRAENFTDHSPPLPQPALPYHLVLSHPFISRMKLSLFAPYLIEADQRIRIFPKIFSANVPTGSILRISRNVIRNIVHRESTHRL